jgi:dipeptidyl aminopeptidase/acylaminoacyl peptidase
VAEEIVVVGNAIDDSRQDGNGGHAISCVGDVRLRDRPEYSRAAPIASVVRTSMSDHPAGPLPRAPLAGIAQCAATFAALWLSCGVACAYYLPLTRRIRFPHPEKSMKLFAAVFALAVAAPALAAPDSTARGPHPFDAHDLVMMDRVSDPHLSPDGRSVAFQLRETDYAANKGRNSIWVESLADGKPHRLTDSALDANSPRWSAAGDALYFLAGKNDVSQLWRVSVKGGAPTPVSDLPLDINNYKLSADGKRVLLSIDVFTGCESPASGVLACTQQKLDARKADKATGMLFDKLFIRHWDAWADGRRSQLFIAGIGADGRMDTPILLSREIDGDVPSKPFGDDSEYAFAPDGKSVYFDVRIAGNSEPWSTNFDVYSVPSDGSATPKNLTAANLAWDAFPTPSKDGKTLYYLAMKRPAFEADRFGIMARDLASGATREIDPQWDRSASALKLSADGKTLYTTSDDAGDTALFAVDIASGKAKKLLGDGTVIGFDGADGRIIAARQDFKHPTDLYTLDAQGQHLAQITHFNADALKDIRFGDYQFFDFKGANGDTVQGYVMKPAEFQPGRKYPVAFLIHGGPQGAWSNDFHYRWNPETYAGQGFGVVAINFHGSTGYGQAFTDAISGDWGGKPLEDLKLGWAAALKNYAWLDGSNACALGASYGGYMVYWMAGNWNTPWKCLVDHDGVFDSRMMYYATEELWFEEWENKGTPFANPQNYEKFNPVNYVDKWRVPMLVVHSAHDFRIPIEQGIGAFTALQRRGIPSEFLTFPDESHFVQKPRNSEQWHATVNAWLKRWTTTQ